MTEFTRPTSGVISETAAELAQRIHNREITSREVTQAYLDRINETNETLNSFLHIGADEALAAADAVDQALDKGEKPASPLAGVP
ncbi:amidase family protein, partial [Corynebacterium sp.]|uniref:amidase family protein n=1 Tax=Corynebacterium sp. TaxID=1720 RepID=UPI0027BACAA8